MKSLEEVKARRAELSKLYTREASAEDRKLEKLQRELEVLREASRQAVVQATDPVKNAADQVRDVLLEMTPGDRVIVERYPETDGLVIFKVTHKQFAPIEVD